MCDNSKNLTLLLVYILLVLPTAGWGQSQKRMPQFTISVTSDAVERIANTFEPLNILVASSSRSELPEFTQLACWLRMRSSSVFFYDNPPEFVSSTKIEQAFDSDEKLDAWRHRYKLTLDKITWIDPKPSITSSAPAMPISSLPRGIYELKVQLCSGAGCRTSNTIPVSLE